ncbi:HD domain-containing protein [Novosphingobium sp. P6W]|uniref:HD domain-containing protein n=1 Tax=Novosphingobium sp. P6W TaxID=1609758 RepID=UPI001F05C1FE|nr:HD domain-containing protein [Novosphingobium sp. P6W]
MIDTIFNLINRFSDERYGEDVTQLEHVLQCAELARLDGAPDSLIAAALLHDIGQFIEEAGEAAETHGIDARHEISGAAFLAPHFTSEVTEPVRLHVAAKRYLCAVEPGYTEMLSRASVLSLNLQGGPMSPQEITQFEGEAAFESSVRLRRYDDQGKRNGWDVPDLESYRPLLWSLMTHA